MLLTVNNFCERVRRDIPMLVRDLQDETGRKTPGEQMSWQESLPRIADLLDQPSMKELHIHLADRASLALEYRLPAANSWCDVVLLGVQYRMIA